MNKNLIASKSIQINANADQLWSVLTDPDKIKIYLFGTETLTDWEEGSPILFQGEYNGQHYKDKGNVLEKSVNKRLQYNYWSGFSGLEDKPENYSLVTYDIEDQGSDTVKFTWTQQGFSSEEGKCHTEAGLESMLEQVKQLAENES